MGQRTQVIIKFRADKEKEIKITFHNQVGYGRILVYASYAILKAIETGIIIDRYPFLREKDYIIEKLRNIIDVNVEKGIYAGWVKYAEDGEDDFVPAEYCDNNDGVLLMDITNLKNLKYAFIPDIYETEKEIITATEYWNKYKDWYKDLNNFDEIKNYVKEWCYYIENNAKLMNKNEIIEYL